MTRSVLLALAVGVLWGSAAAAPRNVLLIVTDDQGLDAGCYGHPVLQTPNIDKLAKEGTRFSHAFGAVSSCSPSRSVILSGLYNHANGQYGLQHATHNFHSFRSVQGLPVLLRKAGYRSAVIGKYHVQPEENYRFDVKKPDIALPRMVENATAFLKEAGDQPFFLYFCVTEPHRKAKGFGNPRTGLVGYDPAKAIVPAFLPDRPEVREEIADYYEAITRADAVIGEVLSALRETGHEDDTLVLFVSDNGMPFPGAKTNLYDAGIHLPLIVRSPQQSKRGVVCNAMVSWADLTPTTLAWAGAKGPDYPLHGRSFLDVLEQSEPAGWDEIYASHTFHEVTMYYPMRAVRTRRYKCILNIASRLEYPSAADIWGSLTWQGVLERKDSRLGGRSLDAFLHRPQYELYDLETDPNEFRNLAGSAESAGVLAELQAKIRAFQEKTNDPWAIKYRHE